MEEENIKIEEVMKRTHKSREFIIAAIQNRTFPGSFSINENGHRNVHIPRKAFEDYMTKFHTTPSEKLIVALIDLLTEKKPPVGAGDECK